MKERTRIGLLLALSALVYLNALWDSFTYDDFLYVLNNPIVTNATFRGFFTATRFTNVFRPLSFFSYFVNWKLGFIHAWGYHLVNVLLHVGVTLLLYLVLKKLLENIAHAETISFVAALLFAVHPLHTEAVTSIVGRSELLAAGFLLAAWLFHLEDQLVPMLACFVLAVLSKESALAFLPLVVAGDFVRGKFKRVAWYGWIAIAGMAYAAVLWNAQGGRFGEHNIDFLDNPLASLPTRVRILNAVHIAWKYLALLADPADLSCDYSYNAIRLYVDWRHLLPPAVAAFALLGLWLWAVSARRMAWVLAGAIYFAAFSTTANILIPTGTIMGERLAYLPSAGFCLLAALVWLEIQKRRDKLAWALLFVLVAALSARTVVRNRDWRTNLTLFSAAVKVVPDDARVHTNLGGFYLDAGDLDAARKELQTALQIYPSFPDAAEFLGLAEARSGHDAAALPWLARALELTHRESPRYAGRAVNLAAMLAKLGRDQEALRLLNDAIAEEPGNPRAWSNRAVIRFRSGDLPAARSDAEMALRTDPNNTQAQGILGALNNHASQRNATNPAR